MSSLDIEFTFATTSDVEEIVGLFHRSYGRTMTANYYHWQFFESPAGGGYSACARIDGRVICHAGYSRRRARFGRERGHLFAKHTSMTHPDYRGKRIYSQLLGWAHEELSSRGGMVLSWPNQMNHGIQVLRDDYFDIYQVPALKKMPGGLKGDGGVHDGLRDVPAVFPEEYSGICSQTVGQAYCSYVRTPEYLIWRYSRRPDIKYYLIEERSAGQLRSAIIFKQYPETNPDRLVVVEWLSDPADRSAANVFEELEEVASLSGMPVILWHNVYDRPRHALLERRGYSLAGPILYFGLFPLSSNLTSRPSEYRNWYISMGDVDIF